MTSITLRDPIPESLGSWDRIVLSARAQNALNAEHEDSQESRKQMLAQDLEKLFSAGNLRERVFCVKRRAGVVAPQLHEVLRETVEGDERLMLKLLTLLFFASEGMDCTALAKELRKVLIEQTASIEVDYSI